MNRSVGNNTIDERKIGSGRLSNSFYEITSKSEGKNNEKRKLQTNLLDGQRHKFVIIFKN